MIYFRLFFKVLWLRLRLCRWFAVEQNAIYTVAFFLFLLILIPIFLLISSSEYTGYVRILMIIPSCFLVLGMAFLAASNLIKKSSWLKNAGEKLIDYFYLQPYLRVYMAKELETQKILLLQQKLFRHIKTIKPTVETQVSVPLKSYKHKI